MREFCTSEAHRVCCLSEHHGDERKRHAHRAAEPHPTAQDKVHDAADHSTEHLPACVRRMHGLGAITRLGGTRIGSSLVYCAPMKLRGCASLHDTGRFIASPSMLAQNESD